MFGCKAGSESPSSGFKSYHDFSNFVKEVDETVVNVIKEQRGLQLAGNVGPNQALVTDEYKTRK